MDPSAATDFSLPFLFWPRRWPNLDPWTFFHHGSWLQFLPMFRAPASELSPHSQFQLQDSQLSLSMTTFCRPTLIYTTLLTDILTRIEMYLMCHLTDIASVWEKCNMKLSNVNTLQHPQHHIYNIKYNHCVILFNNNDNFSTRYDADIASQDIVGARVIAFHLWMENREYIKPFKVSSYKERFPPLRVFPLLWVIPHSVQQPPWQPKLFLFLQTAMLLLVNCFAECLHGYLSLIYFVVWLHRRPKFHNISRNQYLSLINALCSSHTGLVPTLVDDRELAWGLIGEYLKYYQIDSLG